MIEWFDDLVLGMRSFVFDGVSSTTSPSMWITSPGRTGASHRKSSTPSPKRGCGPKGRTSTANRISPALPSRRDGCRANAIKRPRCLGLAYGGALLF